MSINLDFILLEQFSIYSILESARCTGAKKDNVVHRRILVKCNENTTKNMDGTTDISDYVNSILNSSMYFNDFFIYLHKS